MAEWEVLDSKDGNADLAAVKAVKTPVGTNTWKPVAHYDFLDILGNVVENKNLPIARAHYDLTSDGENMFGVWDLDMDGNRVHSLGFRNSHRKQFALGLAAGGRVIACSNLMFSGEFVEFRKHTSRIYMELRGFIEGAVGQITDDMEKLEKWHNSLHGHELPDRRAKLLTFDAMESGVLPFNQFREFHDLYFMATQTQEESLYKERSLHSWHGAITEIYGKHRSLAGFGSVHKKLNEFVAHAYVKVARRED